MKYFLVIDTPSIRDLRAFSLALCVTEIHPETPQAGSLNSEILVSSIG